MASGSSSGTATQQDSDEDETKLKSNPSVLWDPLSPSDWDQQKPSSEAVVRIKRDLHNVFSDPPPGIFVAPHGDDITKVNILITGPFDTPYEGGFFHFFLRYPPTYPHVPPRVKFMTTGDGRVRFNPNLYCNGKVCLSILGTWPGPQWTASQNLTSIVISIQSLLNDKPFHNEPGFTKQIHGWEVESYNDVVRHETLRVAVCDVLEKGKYPNEHREVIKCSFLEFYQYYIAMAEEYSAKLDKKSMMDPFGFNKGIFNFSKLIQRLKLIHSKLKSSS